MGTIRLSWTVFELLHILHFVTWPSFQGHPWPLGQPRWCYSIALTPFPICCPLTISVYLGAFRNYCSGTFDDADLRFTVTRNSKVTRDGTIRQPLPSFLLVVHWNYSSVVKRFRVIAHSTFYWHDLRFKVIRDPCVDHDGAIWQPTPSLLLAAHRKFSSILKRLGIIPRGTFDDPDLRFKVIRNS